MSESTIQSDLDINEMRTRCGQFRDMLTKLAHIHLEVDKPTRTMDADDPDWIGRLRKICFHALAIDRWELGVGVEHILAPEIRAASKQMAQVWMSLPPESRLDGVSGDWWDEDARNGLMATYDHPTPSILAFSAEHGGFGVDENVIVYMWLILWIGRLIEGYCIAIDHLSQILGSGVDIESRMTSALNRMAELINPEEFKTITEELEKREDDNDRNGAYSWQPGKT